MLLDNSKKYLSPFLLVFFFTFFLPSCATKKPVSQKPPLENQTSKHEAPIEKPGGGQEIRQTPTHEAPLTVGIVLGGAGVASFATVGFLKRFEEEGIRINYIVSTGWTSLFALGYGFLRSVHDLEWFAMRLKEGDFFSSSLLALKKDYSSHEKISNLASQNFSQKDLREARIPVFITSSSLRRGNLEVVGTGPWLVPFLKSFSIPGIHRPFPNKSPNASIFSLNGLDVETALARGAERVICLEMYQDYLKYHQVNNLDHPEKLYKKMFHNGFLKNIHFQASKAHLRGTIILNKPPDNFDVRRQAILMGYQEATRLIKELRRHVGD